MLEWSDTMLKSQGATDPAAMEKSMEAFTGYTAYINPVCADRRRTGNTEDLVGVLCHAQIDGDSLDARVPPDAHLLNKDRRGR